MTDKPERDLIDPELVKSLLGKRVLVGITYCKPDGSPLEHKQFYGRIDDISSKGVVLKHPKSGETLTLPPDLSSYQPAEKGEYTLRSTGEVVTDPDLVTTWMVARPDE